MNNTEIKFERPTWLELERVVSIAEAEQITSLSRDALQRHYREKIVRLSPRRVGMRLRDVLAIANSGA
jgi:hypothetical protein